jgi:hypothetical protein
VNAELMLAFEDRERLDATVHDTVRPAEQTQGAFRTVVFSDVAHVSAATFYIVNVSRFPSATVGLRNEPLPIENDSNWRWCTVGCGDSEKNSTTVDDIVKTAELCAAIEAATQCLVLKEQLWGRGAELCVGCHTHAHQAAFGRYIQQLSPVR